MKALEERRRTTAGPAGADTESENSGDYWFVATERPEEDAKKPRGVAGGLRPQIEVPHRVAEGHGPAAPTLQTPEQQEAEINRFNVLLDFMDSQARVLEQCNFALFNGVDKLKADCERHPMDFDTFNLEDLDWINSACTSVEESRTIGYYNPLVAALNAKDKVVDRLEATAAEQDRQIESLNQRIRNFQACNFSISLYYYRRLLYLCLPLSYASLSLSTTIWLLCLSLLLSGLASLSLSINTKYIKVLTWLFLIQRAANLAAEADTVQPTEAERAAAVSRCFKTRSIKGGGLFQIMKLMVHMEPELETIFDEMTVKGTVPCSYSQKRLPTALTGSCFQTVGVSLDRWLTTTEAVLETSGTMPGPQWPPERGRPLSRVCSARSRPECSWKWAPQGPRPLGFLRS